MRGLDHLVDRAALLAWTCQPPLDQAAMTTCQASVRPVLDGFQAEGAISAWGMAAVVEGAALVLAWTEPGGGHDRQLSGCRRDRLLRVLATTGAQLGRDFLGAPPLLVAHGGRPTPATPAQVRAWLNEGSLRLDDPAWDLLAPDLGAWRAGPTTVRRLPALTAALGRWGLISPLPARSSSVGLGSRPG